MIPVLISFEKITIFSRPSEQAFKKESFKTKSSGG